MSVSTRPCKVDLCPAFALVDDNYCVVHRTATKLHLVKPFSMCRECGKEVHVGEYVTVDLTPERVTHAVYPKDQPHTPARVKGETPLLDDAIEVWHG